MNASQQQEARGLAVMSFMVDQATREDDVPIVGHPGSTHWSPMHFDKEEPNLNAGINAALASILEL